MKYRTIENGTQIFRTGQGNGKEYFVLSGILRIYVLSPEGEEITLCISPAPCVLPPSISRSSDGITHVNCDALVESNVVEFPTESLMELMISDPKVRQWGDAVMQAELARRTQRELNLATKTAKESLAQFRSQYPTLEDRIPHSVIASYLGVTPVTLSRLRNV